MTWSVAGYQAVEVIGAGSRGEVWLGRDEDSGGSVALKRLRSPAELDREVLRAEARALVALRHPALVTLLAIVAGQEHLTLVLEYAECGDVGRLLHARSSLSVPEAVALLVPVARALENAHQEGYVHADVSPGNILLRRDGTPALGDLGTARLLGSRPGVRSATPWYVDPFVAAGGAPDRASDVFSLAAVCRHLVTGVPLWRGESAEAVFEAARAGEVRDASAESASLPPRLTDLLTDVLRSGRAVRPTAAEFADRLSDVCEPVAPAGTPVAPVGTFVAPVGTFVAPVGTSVAPLGTPAAPFGASGPPVAGEEAMGPVPVRPSVTVDVPLPRDHDESNPPDAPLTGVGAGQKPDDRARAKTEHQSSAGRPSPGTPRPSPGTPRSSSGASRQPSHRGRFGWPARSGMGHGHRRRGRGAPVDAGRSRRAPGRGRRGGGGRRGVRGALVVVAGVVAVLSWRVLAAPPSVSSLAKSGSDSAAETTVAPGTALPASRAEPVDWVPVMRDLVGRRSLAYALADATGLERVYAVGTEALAEESAKVRGFADAGGIDIEHHVVAVRPRSVTDDSAVLLVTETVPVPADADSADAQRDVLVTLVRQDGGWRIVEVAAADGPGVTPAPSEARTPDPGETTRSPPG